VTITISPESPAGSDAQALLRSLDAQLAALYGPAFRPSLDREALLSPDVTFVVARRDDVAVGCGALLRHGRRFVELKRMYVEPTARGLGVGRSIVEALERVAHDEGYRTARLMTGSRQAEAIALYEALGYRKRAPWADPPDDDGSSLFYERSLADAG
jgi:putative acetyltransferase